jgi:hypothetical protein
MSEDASEVVKTPRCQEETPLLFLTPQGVYFDLNTCTSTQEMEPEVKYSEIATVKGYHC